MQKEGANVAIGYYDEHEDAETVNRLKEIGVKAKAYAHDLKDAQSKDLCSCSKFGGLNILSIMVRSISSR